MEVIGRYQELLNSACILKLDVGGLMYDKRKESGVSPMILSGLVGIIKLISSELENISGTAYFLGKTWSSILVSSSLIYLLNIQRRLLSREQVT